MVSDNEIAELKKLRGFPRKARNRTQTLNFRNVDFSLVRELESKISWEAVLKGKGAHES